MPSRSTRLPSRSTRPGCPGSDDWDPYLRAVQELQVEFIDLRLPLCAVQAQQVEFIDLRLPHCAVQGLQVDFIDLWLPPRAVQGLQVDFIDLRLPLCAVQAQQVDFIDLQPPLCALQASGVYQKLRTKKGQLPMTFNFSYTFLAFSEGWRQSRRLSISTLASDLFRSFSSRN